MGGLVRLGFVRFSSVLAKRALDGPAANAGFNVDLRLAGSLGVCVQLLAQTEVALAPP